MSWIEISPSSEPSDASLRASSSKYSRHVYLEQPRPLLTIADRVVVNGVNVRAKAAPCRTGRVDGRPDRTAGSARSAHTTGIAAGQL